MKDYTADMTNGQKAAIQQNLGYNTGLTDTSNQLMSQGSNLTNYLNTAASNANSIYQNSTVDPTQQIVNNAGQFINNDVLQGQIDSAINDVNRGFQQQQGQINSAASASGGMNSTRAGVLEARALDDAQDRAASISSQLRGDAYNNGLNLATSNYQQGIQNQLNANTQLSSAGSTGLETLLQGANLGTSSLANNIDLESLYQAQAQNEIAGQLTQAQTPLSVIQQYMNSVGGSYGSNGYQTTSQTVQTPSIFGQIAGAAAGFAGLKGAF